MNWNEFERIFNNCELVGNKILVKSNLLEVIKFVTTEYPYNMLPLDNSVAESFFANLKKEEIYRSKYKNRNELESAIAEYMDFYNNERPHYKLKMRTPSQVEQEYYDSNS